MKITYVLDFSPRVLESVNDIFAQGLKKPGRYRGQWKIDRDAEYHVKKAIGHLQQYLESPIDDDTGQPHIANGISRALIALHHHFEGN
jgi:hypothetical protein